MDRPKHPGKITGPQLHTAITRELKETRNFDSRSTEDADTPLPPVRIQKWEGTQQEFLDLMSSYVIRKNEEAAAGISLFAIYTAFEQHMEEHHSSPAQILAGMRAQAKASIPPMRDAMNTGQYFANIQALEAEIEKQKKDLADYKANQQEKVITEQKETILEYKTDNKWYKQNGFVIVVTAIVSIAVGWIASKLGFSPKP